MGFISLALLISIALSTVLSASAFASHSPFSTTSTSSTRSEVGSLSTPTPKENIISLNAALGNPDDTCRNDDEDGVFDQKEFESKNSIRKKFGLPPVTKAEFIQIQAENKQLEAEMIQKQQAAAVSAPSSREKTSFNNKKARKQNVLGDIFSNILQDTCESNFDCERPEVCCDLGFKKMCCRSGEHQLERIPVRVVADDDQWARGTRR